MKNSRTVRFTRSKNNEIAASKVGRPCSSDEGKMKIVFYPGWKETIGKTETSLGGQY